MEECEDHAEPGGVVVEEGTEAPFVEGAPKVIGRRERPVSQEGPGPPKDPLKDILCLPHCVEDEPKGGELEANAPLAVVVGLAEAHGRVDHEEEEGVQGYNVVQDVLCTVYGHQTEDEEVQSPQHLEEASRGVVAAHVEEGDVAKAREPDVRRHKHPNGIVHGFCPLIMV